jgi:GNAT superfamily N-acetyltransferase
VTRATPAGVLIRELTAADGPALRFVFSRLGAESRYRRFHGAKHELAAGELDRLVAVDGWHTAALIAWSPVPRSPIGVARYARCDDFDLAELAVAVVDDWQRRSVGSALAVALRDHARRAGIHRFRASVLHDNSGGLAIARLLGPAVVVESGAGVVVLAGTWGPGG